MRHWSIRCCMDHRPRPALRANAAGYRVMETFHGSAYHAAFWPHEPASFADKRVAVIGIGTSGAQTIQEVAKTIGHLTAFQRTPR